MSTFAPPIPETRSLSDDAVVAPSAEPTARWSPATLIAFRFCFVYFGLYVVTTQMLGGFFPVPFGFSPLGEVAPFKGIVIWTGTHILGLKAVPYQPTGSGDTLHDWVQVFTLLLIATIATAAWSAVSPRRAYPRQFAWFRLFMRVAVGTTMLSYGLVKVVPLQMPVLAMSRLVEPFGNFSPMGVLWYSIGAAPAYEIATGAAEALTGILLLIPMTAGLGTILGLFCVTQVFLLNMTYDVPVKLFSFHLVLMMIFLIAPNARRLFDAIVRHRPAATAPEPAVFLRSRPQRRIEIAQVVFLAWVIAFTLWGNARSWRAYGGGAPRPPLFGVWRVDEMSVDGVVRPPLLTDSTRWRHVIFQTPAGAVFQRMDDSFRRYGAAYDPKGNTVKLTAPDSGAKPELLSYSRPTPHEVVIDGRMDGHAVHLRLKERELNSFLIRSRGFHWVQELPFNR